MRRARERTIRGMRSYWEARAHENAPWYVDTSLNFDDPDMNRFFETGEIVVRHAIDEAPVQAHGRAVAVEIGSGLGRVCRALATRFQDTLYVWAWARR
ncbi:hypothetical protein BH24ACT3_BH24ACT3_05700 [soil metagenome]